MPWNHKNYDFNLQIKPHYMEPIDLNLPDSLRELIKGMLEIDPSKRYFLQKKMFFLLVRYTIDEVFMNSWVQKASMNYRGGDEEVAERIRKVNEVNSIFLQKLRQCG